MNELSDDEARRRESVSLDVVIPVYNEEAVLEQLFEKLSTVFSDERSRKRNISQVHFLFIDDGSTDGSARIIAEQLRNGFPGTLYRLTRNFGHQNAVSAGMSYATADVVGIIDADLQDPPEVLHEMIDTWRTGADVVFGERRKRKEAAFKVFCYWIYYRILSVLSETPLALDSGDFCLMDRKVVAALNALPERLRFVRGLRSWVGFRQVGLPYERDARAAGRSKYTLRRLYFLATDGIASMSIRPLRVAQLFTVLFGIGALGFLFLSLQRYLAYRPTGDRMALYFLVTYMVVSAASAANLICVYILSAYVGRTYLEVKNRPSFIVMEVVGERDPSPPSVGSRERAAGA